MLAACGGARPPHHGRTATTAPAAAAAATAAAAHRPQRHRGADGRTTGHRRSRGKTYVLVPKNLGNPYFDTANKGAQEAAKELGVTVTLPGPATADATQQIQLINSLIAQNVKRPGDLGRRLRRAGPGRQDRDGPEHPGRELGLGDCRGRAAPSTSTRPTPRTSAAAKSSSSPS